MEFSEVHRKYADDIAITALSQRVPGLDYDDVVSEMLMCLWRAWKTFKHDKGAFGPYWWSLWLNRRSDITAAANRIKRPRHVLVDEPILEDSYTQQLTPQPPTDDPREQLVWHLLAVGEPVKNVIEEIGLSRRTYYDLIRSWRTEEVRASLLPDLQ